MPCLGGCNINPRLRAITGSSDVRWGHGWATGDEEHAKPVILAVAVTPDEASVRLDDPVHGLGAVAR